MTEDWYLILGLSRAADDKAIRKQYKHLAKKYHPDRYGKDRIPFQKIQAAYAILGDTEKKKEYDAILRISSTTNTLTSNIKKQTRGSRAAFTREGIPVEPLASSEYHGNMAEYPLTNRSKPSWAFTHNIEEGERNQRMHSLEGTPFEYWPEALFQKLRKMMRDF
ncbi:MAG: J domain-containing protein [Fibrobacteria bacterium]|nr:J domain-containing protein [Fibrobacteria bacterium]